LGRTRESTVKEKSRRTGGGEKKLLESAIKNGKADKKRARALERGKVSPRARKEKGI